MYEMPIIGKGKDLHLLSGSVKWMADKSRCSREIGSVTLQSDYGHHCAMLCYIATLPSMIPFFLLKRFSKGVQFGNQDAALTIFRPYVPWALYTA